MGINPARNRFRIFLVLMSAYYVFLACGFFLFPDRIFNLLNFFPQVFRLLEPSSVPTDKVLLLFSSSFFASLFLVSMGGVIKPTQIGISFIHILILLLSAGGSLYFFMNEHKYFVYFWTTTVHASFSLILIWYSFRVKWPKKSASIHPPISEPTGQTRK